MKKIIQKWECSKYNSYLLAIFISITSFSTVNAQFYGAGNTRAATATAAGNGNTANGTYSFASGRYNNVTGGNGSGAIGYSNTVAGAFGAVALGWSSKAQGNASFAAGYSNQANGGYSVALGRSNVSGGSYAITLGYANTASSNYSLAFGAYSFASANYAVSVGSYVKATNTNSFVLGRGYDGLNYLTNNISNSLAIGFNSTVPTFFVGPSSGVGTTGNVGIGTTNPQAKLHVTGTSYFTGAMSIGTTKLNGGLFAVAGKISAEDVEVSLSTTWPDFVFTKDYELPSLAEVNTYILTNNHLPNVPSAQEVEEEGINLGKMDAILLQKIEELTLYTINQQKQLEDQNKLIKEQEKLIKKLAASLNQ